MSGVHNLTDMVMVKPSEPAICKDLRELEKRVEAMTKKCRDTIKRYDERREAERERLIGPMAKPFPELPRSDT